MLTSRDPRLAGRVAFTYPNFVSYTLARFFIVVALEMQSVAVGWRVYAALAFGAFRKRSTRTQISLTNLNL